MKISLKNWSPFRKFRPKSNQRLFNNKTFEKFLEQTSSIASMIVDDKGFIKGINQGFGELLGYKDDLLEKNIILLIHEDNDQVSSPSFSILNDLQNRDYVTLIHKNGYQIRVLVLMEPIQSGEDQFFLLIFRNITHWVEENVYKQEILKTTLNRAKNAILTIGIDHKILFYNKMFLQHWNFEPESQFLCVGHDSTELINQMVDLLSNSQVLTNGKLLDNNYEEYEEMLCLKDGRFIVCCSCLVEVNEKKIGRAYYFRDITVRKIAEQELEKSYEKLVHSKKAAMSIMEDANMKKKEVELVLEKLKESKDALKNSEERFRDLIEKSNDWFWEIDLQGNFLYSGPQVKNILGIQASDIIGKNYFDLIPLKEKHKIQSLFESKNIINAFESYYDDQNNEKRIVELYVNPLLDKNDKLIGHRGIVRDITMRKQVENMLRERKDRAEQATKAKSIFLANMGHEIRTPLNAIIGTNYLLSQTDLVSKQQNYTERIESSAQLLLRTINDILDFSKIEARAMTLEKIEFNLAEVIKNIASIHAPEAQQKGLELHAFNCLESEYFFIGDPFRLKQILNNFISNAIKFTEKGYIFVKIDFESKEKDIHHFVLSVQDSGMGIAQENISKLFSEFVQEDSSTTRRFGGTGLGLSICKKLADLMNGKIEVTSELGQGSTFKVSFPLPRINKIPKLAEWTWEMKKKRVLIICNKDPCCSIYEKSFSLLFEFVSLQKSIESTIDFIEKEKQNIDIIIIDDRIQFHQAKDLLKISKKNGIKLVLSYKVINTPEIPYLDSNEDFDAQLPRPFTLSDLFMLFLNLFHKESISEFKSRHKSHNKNSLSETRILVVDDNNVNQEVAKEILENMGAEVSLASNGKEVCEMSDLSGNFDIILMDMQMPVMDGVTATKIIKNQKGLKEMPVLALSADMAQEEKEKAFESGVDDYLLKPLESERMLKSILKLTHQDERLAEVEEEAVQKENHSDDDNNDLDYDLCGIEGLDYKPVLKNIGGSVDSYLKFLRMFIKDKESFKEKVSPLITEENWAQVRQEAHSLAGTSGLIGANKLYDLSKKLEKSAKQSDKDGVIHSAKETFEMLELLISKIKKIKNINKE